MLDSKHDLWITLLCLFHTKKLSDSEQDDQDGDSYQHKGNIINLHVVFLTPSCPVIQDSSTRTPTELSAITKMANFKLDGSKY